MAGAGPKVGLSLKVMVFYLGGPQGWAGLQQVDMGREEHAGMEEQHELGPLVSFYIF